MAKRGEKTGLVIRPSEFVAVGIMPEGEHTIEKAYFATFDYAGKQDERPALILEMVTPDGDEVQQAWSAGKLTDWEPSEDGSTLEPVDERMEGKTLNPDTNAGRLFTSLVAVGFDEDILAEDGIASMVGLVVEFRIEIIERKGLGENRNFPVSVISEILSMPGEGKKKTRARSDNSRKASTTKSRTRKKAEPESDTEPDEGAIQEHAEEMIQDLLEEAGSMRVTKIAEALYEVAKDEEDRDEMVALSGDTDWLKSEDRPWDSKKTKLVYSE